MFLESIEYTQFENTPRVWTLEGCTFENINLIVGKNASGKSRILSIIATLANLLSGDQKLNFSSGNWEIQFDNDGKGISYALKVKQAKVIEEKLDIDSTNRLNRAADGEGQIYYEEIRDTIRFQTPENEVAAFARRDSIQHRYLEDLYSWGKSVRRYNFGTQLGQDVLAVFVDTKGVEERIKLNLKDTNSVVAIFKNGEKDFASEFTDPIIRDMGSIGYELEEIGIATPEGLIVESKIPIPSAPVGLYVQESDLKGRTYHNEISQGMFRALSLIIQVAYSQLTGIPSCILIDDIGEGLDYERSSALIKLLIERAKEASIQLIMATNDRFVMNNVPLEYWSVVQRVGGISRIYNYRNSPKLFDDFALTGLNNFDFFSSKYYLKDFNTN